MMKKMTKCNNAHSTCTKAETGHKSMGQAAQIKTTSGQSEGASRRATYMARAKSGY